MSGRPEVCASSWRTRTSCPVAEDHPGSARLGHPDPIAPAGQLRDGHAGERLGGRIERKAGVARGKHTVLDVGQAVGLGQHDLPVFDHRDLQPGNALLQHDLADQAAGLVVGLVLAGGDGGEGQGSDEHEHDSKHWAEHAGFRRGVEDRMQRVRKGLSSTCAARQVLVVCAGRACCG
jgi:hypothetical protein